MNKKVLFTIAPMVLVVGAITGCNGGGGGGSDPQPKAKELTKLKVSTVSTSATYSVGFEFTKFSLNVIATWSDGSFNTVEGKDYSVSPELPYTFKVEDVASGKDFTVTYLTKSQTVHANVIKTTRNINWNGSEKITDSAHGFDGTKNLYETAKTATSIVFKIGSSTDGAHVGETADDKIYAKFDTANTTLTIWSKYKIAFEDDDMIEYMSYTVGPFANCTATTIDLSNVDTSTMTSMNGMFLYCSQLETVKNISNLNTSNATSMNSMFLGCEKLTSIDLSSFDTSKVTNMESMFQECYALTSLDVSKFDTSKVTNMGDMFGGYETMNLNSITFGDKFDTSKVENMQRMFAKCEKLTSIDLSNFSFAALTNSKNMFDGCSELVRIYAKTGTDLNARTELTVSTDMFKGCVKLCGGKGTTCDGTNNINKVYARIDGGSDDKGYFTDKTQPIEIPLNYKKVGGVDYYIGNEAGAFNVGNKFKAIVNYDSTKLQNYNTFAFTPSDGQSSYTLTKDSADKTKQILVTSAKKASDGTSVLDDLTIDEVEGLHCIKSSSPFTESIIIECTIVKDALNSLIVSATNLS